MVVGLLASLVSADVRTVKGAAFDSVAKSDLQNAVGAQEAYFDEHHTYAPTAADLSFSPSEGVELGGVGTPAGYHMTARHRGSSHTFSSGMGGGWELGDGNGAEDGSSGAGRPRGDLRRAG
jgi:hypothetical protein